LSAFIVAPQQDKTHCECHILMELNLINQLDFLSLITD